MSREYRGSIAKSNRINYMYKYQSILVTEVTFLGVGFSGRK